MDLVGMSVEKKMERPVKIGDAVSTTMSIMSSVGEYKPGLIGVVTEIHDDTYNVEFRLLGFVFVQVLPKQFVKPLS